MLLASQVGSAEELLWAQTVLGNWRACHGYPINTFQATLRMKLKRRRWNAIVAQRLKRSPSIVSKLQRFESMRLSQMQDIGGLRAVVGSIAQVRELEESYRNGRFAHELVFEKDYIATPKTDGYRSVHLVFKYRSARTSRYDGLLLELQVRTRRQHAWATAVETMGTFLGQALKARQGEQRWLKFFEVVGAAFAHLEKAPAVPGYESLTTIQTFARVAAAEADLEVLEKLRGFSVAVGAITKVGRPDSYHLVVLDSEKRQVDIVPYPKTALDQAMAAYAQVESLAKAGESLDAVLVSAGPIESLKRAYPNYFLDTDAFIQEVEGIIRESGAMTGSTGKRGPQPGKAR